MIDFNELLNKEIKEVKPSGIRKFFDLANTIEGVVSLGVGEPDFDTPYHIIDAGIYALGSGKTAYTANQGLLSLRQEIANYVKRKYSLSYDPNKNILVTVGGSEAIDLAYRALLNEGDEVIVPVPTYVAYEPGAILAKANVKKLYLSEKDNFKVTPEALKKCISPKTKILIMNYPSNPTGGTMDYEDYLKLVPIIKENKIIVVSDEIYSELIYDNYKHYSLANFDEIKDQVILINGFSKAFAMTGWRLAYICANEILLKQMLKIHQYTIMCAPTMSQYAGVEALKNGDIEVEKMRKSYEARRNYIVKAFNDLGLETHKPKGAFYIFPSIKKTGLSSEEFCEDLLNEQKVACVPGTAFDEAGEGFIRVSFAYSIDELKEAVRRIKKYMEKYD